MYPSNPITRTSGARQVARLATLGIAGAAYFAAAVIAQHFLRPDIDPVKYHMSGYAVGPYGFIMTSAFFALALGALALAAGLWQESVPSTHSKAGLILLAVFGAGVAVAGIFPADLQFPPQTTSGTIHEIASLAAFVSLLVAQILLSRKFRQDDRWRSFSRPALALALLALVAFIGVFATAETEFVGLSQRIYVAVFLAWLLLTAIRLRSANTASSSA